MIARALTAVVLALVFVSCGGTQATRSGKSSSAVVKFDSEIKGGEVWFNGRLVPGALRNGVEVPPGNYRIEVRHERYHTVYFELTVKSGDTRTLMVRPAEVLP